MFHEIQYFVSLVQWYIAKAWNHFLWIIQNINWEDTWVDWWLLNCDIIKHFPEEKFIQQGHSKGGEKKLEPASTLWYESFPMPFIRTIWEMLSLEASETERVPKSLLYYLNQVSNSNRNLCLKSQKYFLLNYEQWSKGQGPFNPSSPLRPYVFMLSS